MRATRVLLGVALTVVVWLLVQPSLTTTAYTSVDVKVAAPSPGGSGNPQDVAGGALVQAPLEPPCSLNDDHDVPILRMRSCPPGHVGYACDQRFDTLLSYLPDGARWRSEWANPRARRCQALALDSLVDTLVRAHTPSYYLRPSGGQSREHIYVINDRKHPCTVGKMLHQFAVANHAALTAPAPPGRGGQLLWQVRDDPDWHYTRNGTICTGRSAGWFCLWRPFPAARDEAAVTSAEVQPPAALWPPLAVPHDNPLQYLLMGATIRALTLPTDALLDYLRPRLRAKCADGRRADMSTVPPRCPGARGVAAAVQVRHGDSCEGAQQDVKGPRNMMIRDGKRLFRYCYRWRVYLAELEAMRETYGVDTVMIATDDPAIIAEATAADARFNWIWVDWPRDQLARPKPWVEFRQNLDEHVPLSLAAELELLAYADVFVGSFGSQVGRSIYYRMCAHARTGTLPPFASVDGYGLCCDFREDCTEQDILQRRRPMRTCIEKGGSETFLRVSRASAL